MLTKQTRHIIEQSNTCVAVALAFNLCKVQVHKVHGGKHGHACGEIDEENEAIVSL